jgi:cytochrome c5
MRKRLSVLLLTTGMALIVAGSAVFAQLRSGSYGSGKASSIEQTAAAQLSTDGNYSVASYPSFAPELAEGEGRAETQSFCSMCHSTRYITMQPPLPAAVWEAEVNKMTKTLGAPIPEASAKKIIAYLQAHYTPENRKQ